MEEGILTEHRSLKKLVNVSTPAAGAELKSAPSLPDAGIADCRVRRVGKAESNGRYSNSCMHVTTSCTLILSHPFWAAFYVLPICIFSIDQVVVSHSDPGYIVHITFLECTSSRFSFWRIVSQSGFILLALFMVHSFHMSQAIL